MAQEKSIKEKGTEKTAEKIKKEAKTTEEIISKDKSKEKTTNAKKTKIKPAEKLKEEVKHEENVTPEGKDKEDPKAKKTKTKPVESAEKLKEEVKPEIKSGEKVTEEKTRETKEEGAKAEKTEEKKTLGKVYTIPLSDVYNQPWSKRARKATRMVREFLQKHTKKEVKIAGDVNEAIWARGMKHPPRKIRVNVEIEDNIATARLLK